jgi:hypothetical protein
MSQRGGQVRQIRPTQKPMIVGWCLHGDSPQTRDEDFQAMMNHEILSAHHPRYKAFVGAEGIEPPTSCL